MPTNTMPELSLKAAGVSPTAFQGITFKPEEADTKILINSLANIEGRIEKATEKKSELDQALAKVEAQINPAEQEWFNNYKNNLQNKIKAEVDAGDYGAAIKVATGLADKTVLDTEVQNRIKSQQNYKKAEDDVKKKLEKGEISRDTYDYWKHKNKYHYEDKYDENGEVISTPWEDTFTLYNDGNTPGLLQQAFAMVKPDQIDNGRSWSYAHPKPNGQTNKDGNPIASDSTTYRAQEFGSRKNSFTEVTYQDIMKVADALESDPRAYGSFKQNLEVAFFKLEQREKELQKLIDSGDTNSITTQLLKEEINALKKKTYKNGSPISIKDYIRDEAIVYAKSLAYKIKKTDRSDGYADANIDLDTGSGRARRGSGRGYGYTPAWQEPDYGEVKTPNLRGNPSDNKSAEHITDAADNITTMMEQAKTQNKTTKKQ